MILVSIFGDFDSDILPVFYQFKDKITKHILLYDHNVVQSIRLNQTIQGMRRFQQMHEHTFDFVFMDVNEDRLESIQQRAREILEMAQSAEEIYVNATDGIATIGIILSQIIMDHGGKVIVYERDRNEYNTIWKGGMELTENSTSMAIEEHLILKGATLPKSNSREDFLLQNRDAIETVFSDIEAYLAFRNILTKPDVRDAGFLHGAGKLYFPEVYTKEKFDSLIQSFQTLKAIDSYGNIYPDSRKYMVGLVFEDYLYFLLEKMDFKEVRTGLEVKFIIGEEEYILNEYDILAIRENHLHIIECKAGRSFIGRDIIYKYDSLSNHLDKDGRAVIINVDAKPQNSKKIDKECEQCMKGAFSKGDYSRAKMSNICIYQSGGIDVAEIRNTIKTFLIDMKWPDTCYYH